MMKTEAQKALDRFTMNVSDIKRSRDFMVIDLSEEESVEETSVREEVVVAATDVSQEEEVEISQELLESLMSCLVDA
jgi:hypothetical protein